MYPHNLRAYYTSAGKKTLDGGLELWRGYFQCEHIRSLVFHSSHIFFNIAEVFAPASGKCSLT
jgi:hypothetical protein